MDESTLYYTENYGKIEIDKNYEHLGINKKLNDFLKISNVNNYIIYDFTIKLPNNYYIGKGYKQLVLIDNYGRIIYLNFNYSNPKDDYIKINSYKQYKGKYILSDKLIDLVKKFDSLRLDCLDRTDRNDNNIINFHVSMMEQINKISEDYYNNFVRFKNIYKNGKLEEYTKICEEIENLKLNIKTDDIKIKFLENENAKLKKTIKNLKIRNKIIKDFFHNKNNDEDEDENYYDFDVNDSS